MSKGNKFWGALLVLLVIIFIAAFTPFFSEDKSEEKDSHESEKLASKEKTEENEEDNEKKHQSNSNDNDKEDDNIQEDNESIIKPRSNTVYGQLTDTNAEEVAGMYYNQEDDLNYIVGDNKEILQIEKSFEDLPLDENIDQSLIKEHTLDYMEDDVSIRNTINGSELEYYSPSIDKTYNVVYEKNNENKITNITISSF